MGLKTEGIIFLSVAWGIIITIAGYFTSKFSPLKKLRQNGVKFIRKWSVE